MANISVVIPVYNGARFLCDAIGSLRAQTRSVDEIIVVDDGSTDGSGDLAKTLGPGIVVLRHDHNQGPAASRNRGIMAARNAILGFLDADDLWMPDAASLLLARMKQPPPPDIVAGRIRLVEGATKYDVATATGPEGYAMHFGSCLIRRAAFDEIGLPDPALRYGEDTDWFLRARERGVGIAVIDAVTMIHRRHEGNVTLGPDYTVGSSLEVIKRSLDRRRAAGKSGALPRWPALGR
jgi:glycosyltransferase involved in cell wall biosynthesis